MANNRMWLVHRPSGLWVRLGKRIATSWYGSPGDMQAFYDEVEAWCEAHGWEHQDHFGLDMEDAGKAPEAREDVHFRQ